jgi:hypothetical protein
MAIARMKKSAQPDGVKGNWNGSPCATYPASVSRHSRFDNAARSLSECKTGPLQ